MYKLIYRVEGWDTGAWTLDRGSPRCVPDR